MAHYINNFDLDVPMQRVGDGQYMFGSRKIFAKIMNDKLVVRVGGGYMLIDEFLATYGQQELDKLHMQAQKMPTGSFTGGNMGSPGRKGSPNASQTMNKQYPGFGGRASPTGRGSPTAQRKKQI